MMRAYSSTLKLLDARVSPASDRLVIVTFTSLSFNTVERLSEKLGVPEAELLELIGVPERTAARRRRDGTLKPDESDRLLRVARIVEEATRVFGAEEKAARWLRTPHPLFGDAAPLGLLDSDAGTQQVSDELTRIDYGDFA